MWWASRCVFSLPCHPLADSSPQLIHPLDGIALQASLIVPRPAPMGLLVQTDIRTTCKTEPYMMRLNVIIGGRVALMHEAG